MKLNRIEAIAYYKKQFLQMGMDEADADAEAKHALSTVLNCSMSDLYLKGSQSVTDTQQFRMNGIIKERRTGKPLAYILKERWFMGLRFYVTPDVLIPRQETELLAETAVQLIRFKNYASVLDMCTGSGCVAISVAKYTRARVTAADISPAALEIAKKNAKDIGARVQFVESDLFSELNEKYDIITANPPYVDKEVYEGLMREVRDFEPRLALVAKDKGLAFYKRIAAAAPDYINNGGTLLLEIGDEQGAAVKQILTQAGFTEVRIRKDYSGNDRMASAVYRVE